MLELTSIRNPLLQKIRRAATAGQPTEDGLIVAEGPHLLEEANSGPWRVEKILATSEAIERHRNLLAKTNADVIRVSTRALLAITDTKTPQELVMLLRSPDWSWVDVMPRSALVLILDAIQDPGNAGTMVRSAEAFGVTGIVFLRGSARVANGKFIRATAGSIFRLPYLEAVSIDVARRELAAQDLAIFALAPSASQSLLRTDLKQRCALAVGNEGRGLSDDWESAATLVSVPTNRVESLNAAVACSIALFEAHRQRSSYESL